MTSQPLSSPQSGQQPGERFWAIVPRAARDTALATQPGRTAKVPADAHWEYLLLQQTVERLAPLATTERTLVVCGPAHAAP
jgi:hypothetical protein